MHPALRISLYVLWTALVLGLQQGIHRWLRTAPFWGDPGHDAVILGVLGGISGVILAKGLMNIYKVGKPATKASPESSPLT